MKKDNLEVQELIEQGKVLYAADRYEEALTCFQEAGKLDPYAEAVYENMAVCYIMMDRYEDARTTLNRYLLLNKNSGTAYFHLGNIALLDGKPAEAKAHYSKAQLAGFQNPVMHINMASFYEEIEDYDSALEQYRRLLSMTPYDYGAMEKKTQMLLRANRLAEALASAKTMVSTDIDRFEGHRYVYVSLIALGRNEDAGKYIEEAVRRFPDNKGVRFDQARFFDMVGDPDRGLEILNREFSGEADAAQTAMLRLSLLMQKKCAQEAVQLIESTPSLRKDGDILVMLYSLYYGMEDYDKALAVCGELQGLGEDAHPYWSALYFAPLAKRRLGREDEALAEFAQAADRLRRRAVQTPEQIDLNLYRALCEYQIGNYAEAKKLIEYLLALQPDAGPFHMTAIPIYEALGDHEQAERHRAIAREQSPELSGPLL